MIGDYGLYAVFWLMLIDAVLPAASELVMVYGGALAAGAFANQEVTLFGRTIDEGWPAFLAIALAGTIGYTLGSMGGWAIGLYGGRPVSRASRSLAAPERGEARPRRTLVRALGRLGGLPRPTDAGHALVRLDPGRRLRGAVRALHAADARRIGDLVLRVRGCRVRGGRGLGGLPPRLPVRRIRRRCRDRRRGGVVRLALSEEAPPKSGRPRSLRRG